jgi:hypothetical protein
MAAEVAASTLHRLLRERDAGHHMPIHFPCNILALETWLGHSIHSFQAGGEVVSLARREKRGLLGEPCFLLCIEGLPCLSLSRRMMSRHRYDSIYPRRPVSIIIYEYPRMQDMIVHCALKTTFRGTREAAAWNFGTGMFSSATSRTTVWNACTWHHRLVWTS